MITTEATTTTTTTDQDTPHPYAGVKGTRRCACGRGHAARVHRVEVTLSSDTPSLAGAPAVEPGTVVPHSGTTDTDGAIMSATQDTPTQDTPHTYAGVKGTRRCACGRGHAAKIHRVEAPAQVAQVDAPAEAEAPAQVTPTEAPAQVPAPGKARCTVSGFSAHSRRPAECRHCGNGRDAAHHVPAAPEAPAQVTPTEAPAEAPAQVDAPAAPEAPAHTRYVGRVSGAGIRAYADRRAEAARLLAEARDLVTDAQDQLRMASEQIDTPRFSPFRGTAPVPAPAEADTLATWATDAPEGVAPADMPADVLGRRPAEAVTTPAAPAVRRRRPILAAVRAAGAWMVRPAW